jgi:DNA-directed RNA polymerase specialized sigma24 family protein
MPRRSVVEGTFAGEYAPAQVVLDLGPVGPASERERIYRRAHRRLTGVATVLLGSPSDADGLVHDAFVRVVASEAPIADEEVERAVVHQLVLLSRARARLDRVPPGVPRTASRVARRCRRQVATTVDAALLDRILGLAPCEREALALCTVGGLSPVDAALTTGSTAPRVESDLARAVRVLSRPTAASTTIAPASTVVATVRDLGGPGLGGGRTHRRSEPGPDDWARIVAGAARLRHQRWKATVGTAGAAAVVAVMVVGGGLGGPHARRSAAPVPAQPAPVDVDGSSTVVFDDELAAKVSITIALGAFAERDDRGYPFLEDGGNVDFYAPLLAQAGAAFRGTEHLVLHVHEIRFLSGWQAEVDVLVHVPTETGAAEVPLKAYVASIEDRWVLTRTTLRQVVGIITDGLV